MRSRVHVLAALLLVAAVAAPATVSADTGGGGGSSGFGTLTIAIGSPVTLKAKLLLTVPVSITCTPPDGFISVDETFDDVLLSQASSRTVATAEAFTPNGGTFTCDGTLHRYTATAVAGSVPFHGGQAIASMSASVCGTRSDFSFDCTSVSIGPLVVKISG